MQAYISGIDKGTVTTAHSAITATATSSYINTSGYNALLVYTYLSGSGTWDISLQGKMIMSDTAADLYDNNDNQLSTGNITASRVKLFVGMPNHVCVVATEVDGTASCTVRVQPVNV